MSEANGAPLAPVVPVELSPATDALARLGARVVALVRSIQDPAAGTRGLEWSLAETAVHVLQTTRSYEAGLTGELQPETEVADVVDVIARKNREEIESEPERAPAKIASALDDALRGFVAAARAAGPDRIAVFSTEYSATGTGVVCALIGELAIHGWDIARSIGARWDVERDASLFAAYASAAAAPLVLDSSAAAGVDVHVRIKLRGGIPFSIRVRDGRAWSEQSDEVPEATIAGDPFAYLLAAYGRTGPILPMLRGRLVAYGRRPWKLLTLAKVLRSP